MSPCSVWHSGLRKRQTLRKTLGPHQRSSGASLAWFILPRLFCVSTRTEFARMPPFSVWHSVLRKCQTLRKTGRLSSELFRCKFGSGHPSRTPVCLQELRLPGSHRAWCDIVVSVSARHYASQEVLVWAPPVQVWLGSSVKDCYILWPFFNSSARALEHLAVTRKMYRVATAM